jgi:outer membrane murein-binding lipoprotein Lpp
MSVRYEQLVPALIKAVQELSAKVAELEQKLKEK